VDRRAELIAAGDHALRDEEPGGEFDVVARGAHRDGERRASDTDLERLFDRERIGATHWFGAPSGLASKTSTSAPRAPRPRQIT
jgi:hypothetical protein